MSGDLFRDALPDMKPGECRELVQDGHVIHITATHETGFNTGRRRYRVECLTCADVVHEATTGPMHNVGRHLREAKIEQVTGDNWPSEHEGDCPHVTGGDCRCPMGNL